MKFLLALMSSFALTGALSLNALEIGDAVPDFTALDENGAQWKLSDQRAEYLVIYFYPAAFTGGCTKQACSYRDHEADYAKLGAEVIGVSGDEVKNLKAFKDHHNLNFTLLSDEDGKIAGLFGVPTRSGNTIEKEVGGNLLQLSRGVTTARWTFVVDRNGKLIYKDSEVSAATDPETVLKEISTYQSRRTCTPN